MPKRIEPLSSRAKVVDQGPPKNPRPKDAANDALQQPRRMEQPRRSSCASKGPQKKWTIWRKMFVFAQVCFILAVIVAAVAGYFIYEKALVYYARAETYDLKKLDDLNVTSTFYDINGEELGRIFVEDRIVLKPEEIPNTMRQAVMAAEDKRFYEHGAIDYFGIVRALKQDLMHKSRGVQGGSTIEQQLAKHLIGDFSRTLDRKFLEAFVAIRLEQNLSKDQIMNYYLNRIYFGKGYFGVGAAARGYFGKDASQLTVPECALLAGIIRSPVTSSPRTDPFKAKMHRDQTLKTMYEMNNISRDEYIRDIQQPVRVLPPKTDGRQTYVMVAAVKELEQILEVEGTEEMPQGLTVRTNIDLRLQRALETTLNEHLTALEAAQPPAPAPADGAKPVVRTPLQGAAIVVDVPTGRVEAWIGGRDFNKNQYDHISMAKRESGALLQPLLYGLAFDRLNLTPASMINASYIDPAAPPAQQDLALGNPQTDLNKWFLSVEDALALGNKSAATRVGLKLEPSNVNDWFHKAGIEQGNVPAKPHVFTPDPMTLGDIASIYQILGNGGEKRKLKLIRSITAMNGKSMYEDGQPDHNDGRDAMLNNLNDQQLTLTLQNSLREGPARTLTRDYGFHSAMAGMPGYSEGYRDAWFVGFTPQTLAGVWVGFDDSRAIGPRELAVKSAVPLWGDVMRQITARQQTGSAFPVPAELTKVEIDRSTGAVRGLAGLAPAPNDIFVYLTKDQLDAASTSTANSTIAPPEWSDWLTTMFNQADETGLTGDQLMGGGDKRSNIIPALAEYKMPGIRGDLISSDGAVYATTASEKNLVLGWPGTDQATADADIVKWMRTRLGEVQQTIGSTLNISDTDLLNQYKTQRYQPLMVVENLTPDQVDKIQAAGLEGKGFGFQTAPLRVYPKGTQLAHVLGYLARDQQRNKGKYLSGDVIYDRYKGASGLEEVYNKDLAAGKDGRFMISTSSDGYARSAAVAEQAGIGNNVRMSIDSKFQTALETAMAQSTNPMKAGVVMNVQTGDVVAMASHPTYDPNVFVPSIDADMWNLLNTGTYNPLLDRTLHAQYPPGSQFKTVTSVAAMRAGVFDPNWVVHCTGGFDLGSMHMDLKNEHGDITYLEALTHSYNTYFAELGLKVGRDVLVDTARSFNFGSLTHINLPGELPGFIPDEESVKRMHQRDFGVAGGDTALTAIGQGDVLVTPLQMADFMAALANGGTVYTPRLVKDVEDHNGNIVQNFPTDTISTVQLDDKWMPIMKEAMINVIDEGTATVVHRDDIKVAAKTGTAQVGTKTKRRQIAWLSGYWPADNPQYSFSVMVEGRFEDNRNDTEEGGLLGGRECGQIVHDMMDILYPTPGKHKKDKDEVADDDSSKKKHPGEDKSANEDLGQSSTASTDVTPATNAVPVNPSAPPSDVVVPANGTAPTPVPAPAPPAGGNTAGPNVTQ